MPERKNEFEEMLSKIFGNWFREWFTGSEATTAIEFSLLAIPFFTLTLSIIEMSIMFTTATVLEGATGTAARMIRTGQVQQSGLGGAGQEEMFRNAVCDHGGVLLDCDGVQIEVVNIGNFASFDDYAPDFDEDGNMISSGFNAGGVNDVILIRTAYRYTLMTPFVGQLLGEGTTNTRLFISTMVLQTEPYEFEGA